VTQAQYKKEAERRRLADRPTIVVSTKFRAMGRVYEAGTYAVEQEELDQLQQWQGKSEAYATMRGWERPEGYTIWPPFTLAS
jgi:hypothetical protein